jgi:hypothetical protein
MCDTQAQEGASFQRHLGARERIQIDMLQEDVCLIGLLPLGVGWDNLGRKKKATFIFSYTYWNHL